MTTTAKKIQTLDVSLNAKPGALAKIYSAFQEAGVNVQASWAYEMGPGEANAHFFATDLKKAQTVLTKLDMEPEVGQAVWVEGDDRVGGYAEVLGKIAKAGININATDAFGFNGKFATVLFADTKDFTTLCKTLNI